MLTYITVVTLLLLTLVIATLGQDGCPDTCRLPSERGKCLRYKFRMWFYDFNGGKCAKFSYGGCHGNANKFWGQDECEEYCKECKKLLELNEVSSDPDEDPCKLEFDQGSRCEDQETMPSITWFFNPSATPAKCEAFAFTGCGGNENNFESEQQCNEKCLRE